MKNRESFNPSSESASERLPATTNSSSEPNGEEKFHTADEGALEYVREFSDRALQEAQKTLRFIEQSTLSSTQKETLFSRVQSKVKKLFRIFTFATALVGTAAGGGNYIDTRYSVESKIDETGKIVYTHQDEETTHVINVLSGKESLNDFDKKELLLDYLGELNLEYIRELNEKGEYDGEGERVPDMDTLENMSLTELRDITNDTLVLLGENPEENFTSLGSDGFDQELYDALWRLEQESGSPKVRFRLGGKRKILSSYDPGRDFYSSITNTVFIAPDSSEVSIDGYLAELSHSRQFNENPILSNIQGARDMLGSLADSVITGDKVEASYRKLYEKPGTLEYDAHSIIEPELTHRFEALTPQRTKRLETEREKEDELMEEKERKLKELRDEKIYRMNKAYEMYIEKDVGLKGRQKIKELYRKEVDEIEKEFKAKEKVLFESFGGTYPVKENPFPRKW